MSLVLLLAAASGVRSIGIAIVFDGNGDVGDVGDVLSATVTFTDHTDAPVAVDDPAATLLAPDGTHIPLNVFATGTTGTYEVETYYLDQPGSWRLHVIVTSPSASAETKLFYARPDPTL